MPRSFLLKNRQGGEEHHVATGEVVSGQQMTTTGSPTGAGSAFTVVKPKLKGRFYIIFILLMFYF